MKQRPLNLTRAPAPNFPQAVDDYTGVWYERMTHRYYEVAWNAQSKRWEFRCIVHPYGDCGDIKPEEMVGFIKNNGWTKEVGSGRNISN